MSDVRSQMYEVKCLYPLIYSCKEIKNVRCKKSNVWCQMFISVHLTFDMKHLTSDICSVNIHLTFDMKHLTSYIKKCILTTYTITGLFYIPAYSYTQHRDTLSASFYIKSNCLKVGTKIKFRNKRFIFS